MKAKKYDDPLSLCFEIFESVAKSPVDFDLPEFLGKLFLMTLGALIPLAMALLPIHVGLVSAGVILSGGILMCLRCRGTILEWGVVAAIGFVLIALAMPPVSGGEAHLKARQRIAAHEKAERERSKAVSKYQQSP